MANNKNKKKLFIKIGIAAAVIIIIVLIINNRNASKMMPEIRTAEVERGFITASVSANGVIRPVTTVEVKSNVGGQIVELNVDEGDIVKAGQLIAKIDPADSTSNLQQSLADYDSATSKVQQSKNSLDMQLIQSDTSIESAKQALEANRRRLAQAQKLAEIQPRLTREAINQAESNLASANATLKQMKSALIPQKKSSAKSSYDQAVASYDQSKNDVVRKQALLDKGFISKSQMEAVQEQFDVASAQKDSAKIKYDTVIAECDQDLSAAQAKVDQATAALETAKANSMQDYIKQQDLAAAKAAVKQSMAALKSAQSSAYQNKIKGGDIVQARAQLQRSEAAVKNAKTQVGYTTILAPRSGVVVKKYVEVGSIVTGGKSAFSGSGSGVTIVDIADTTRMMVEVNVDETDIAQIKIGQKVNVSVDAFADKKFEGRVSKIAPKAIMDQNVTTIPVTVEVTHPDPGIKPEMNATCDFIINSKSDVLMVPSEAIKETRRGSTVTVIKDGKQEMVNVETGIVGDEKTEIISGLTKGQTIVTSVIDTTLPGAGASPQGGRGGGRGMRPF